MILFSVAAIMLLTQVPITAKEGPAVLFWTAVLLVFFFVPYGLMTAELGSTYADTGGIYSWVQRAFGGFWGTQVSWWYWINVGIWLPSVYLMFATLLGQTFDFTVGFWWTVGMAVALIWINFADQRHHAGHQQVGHQHRCHHHRRDHADHRCGRSDAPDDRWLGHRVDVDRHAAQLGQHGAARRRGLQLPRLRADELGERGDAGPQEGRAALDLHRWCPHRGLLPRSPSSACSSCFRPTASTGRTVSSVFSETGIGSSGVAGVVVMVLSVGALYCFFAALVPWTIGANRAAAEAARRGDLPPVLGRTSKRFRTPVAAATATALVGTFFTVGYGLVMELSTSPKVETLFWNLFAFSTVVFLLSYLVMAAAFLKLRYSDPDAPRPYRVPGGMVGAWITSTARLRVHRRGDGVLHVVAWGLSGT